MGGPLINVFLRVYFDDSFFVFLLLLFGVLIGIIGGTPVKRISEAFYDFLR